MKKSEILNLLYKIEKLSECKKRRVGAVLITNKTIYTGFNHPIQSSKGVCYACSTKQQSIKELCPAIHAEIDCLLKAGKDAEGSTLVVSYSPCPDCCRAIIKAGVTHVIVASCRKKPVIEQFWYLYEADTYDKLAEIMLNDSAIKYTRLNEIALNDTEVEV